MAKAGIKESLEIYIAASQLAASENELWQITEKKNFSGIAAEDGVLSGEDIIVKKIDAYFAETKNPPLDIQDLVVWKDPEVEAFFIRHPQAQPDFELYAQQYLTIANDKALLDEVTGSSTLSDKLIKAVDDNYEKDGPGGAGFNANRTAAQILGDVSPEILEQANVARAVIKMGGKAGEEELTSEEAQKFIHKIHVELDRMDIDKEKRSIDVVGGVQARNSLAGRDMNDDGEFNAADLKELAKGMSKEDQARLKGVAEHLGDRSFSAVHVVDKTPPLATPQASGKQAAKSTVAP